MPIDIFLYNRYKYIKPNALDRMMSLKTTLEMLYHWESTTPSRIYMKQPVKGEVKRFTWQQVGEQARKIAANLIRILLSRYAWCLSC